MAGLDKVAEGADAAIWCASGFNEAGEAIDVSGIPRLAKAFPVAAGPEAPPKLVMCSSAGVTRPDWPEAKKELLIGASDIPIIRLNPGGILGQKVVAETSLREAAVPSCIVRPTGLKDDWPSGRPILSQGDVAVGRTAPADLARVLVGLLDEPAASGKTMEMFTLQGYPAGELATSLEGLAPDTAPPTEAAVEASYRLLQQMLPGEQQDATKLEMGRTYEQVDSGEVAPRSRAATSPTEREQQVADGALSSLRAQGRKRDMLKRLFSRVAA